MGTGSKQISTADGRRRRGRSSVKLGTTHILPVKGVISRRLANMEVLTTLLRQLEGKMYRKVWVHAQQNLNLSK